MAEEKKKPGALVAMLAGGHSEPDEDDASFDGDEEGTEGGPDAAFAAFAAAAGIKDTPEAKDALKEFVKSCTTEYGPEEE